jgi:HlyD family secretion protein
VADLLSSDAVRIGPGTRAIVERWGGPDPLEAVLTRIEPAAETRVSALGIEEQRVDAIFEIETPPGGQARVWATGSRCSCGSWNGKATTALQVPLGALFRRDVDWAVFVVEGDVARERIVTLGQRGARQAEILEGLTEGDMIVTHPSDDGVMIGTTDGVTIVDRSTL